MRGIVLQGGRRAGAAVGVDAEVFMVCSQDKVLQRFVEQIIEDVLKDEIFKAFFQDRVIWVQQRFVEQNLDARVCRAASDVVEAFERISHIYSCSCCLPLGTWISSTSHLHLAVTCFCAL